MKKSSPDVRVFIKPVSRFFYRFHITVFIIVITGGLMYAVYSLYHLVTMASDPTSPTTTTSLGTSTMTSANSQITINQIKTLYPSSEAPSAVPPSSGRPNPFGE